MAKVEYKSIIKDGWLHFPDRYVTLSNAAKFLGLTRPKLEVFIEKDMLIWEQPKNSKERYVEIKTLGRLKHPGVDPDFSPLTVQDGRLLQKAIDEARHKIAALANLPPGAIKISFDMGAK